MHPPRSNCARVLLATEYTMYMNGDDVHVHRWASPAGQLCYIYRVQDSNATTAVLLQH